jgi:hypothetical protein
VDHDGVRVAKEGFSHIDRQNCECLHGTANSFRVDLPRLEINRNRMEFDIEVRRRFIKRSVGRRWDNPVGNQSAFSTCMRDEIGPKHTFQALRFPSQRVPSHGAS